MLIQEEDGTWWIASELGPEAPQGRRQISDREARRMLAEYKAGDARRLEGLERAKAPEFAI